MALVSLPSPASSLLVFLRLRSPAACSSPSVVLALRTSGPLLVFLVSRLTSLLPTATLPGVTDVIPTGEFAGLSSTIGATVTIGDILVPFTVPIGAPVTGSVTLSGNRTGVSATATLPIRSVTAAVPALSTLLPAVASAVDTGRLGAGITPTDGLGISALLQQSPFLFRDLDSITNILSTSGLPSITLLGGILPTTGLPGVIDILPGTGLPGIANIINTDVPSVTFPGGVVPTTGLPDVTSFPPV
ncbi:hypothetical protein CF326_g6991 [Tilletia indica]|nr:hypothetical protein CF326_g6991 [Tilletia indica]